MSNHEYWCQAVFLSALPSSIHNYAHNNNNNNNICNDNNKNNEFFCLYVDSYESGFFKFFPITFHAML